MKKIFKNLIGILFIVSLLFIMNMISFADICSHNYHIDYSVVNSDGHSVVCSICGDKKTIDHIFDKTYDGLFNNQCECGYNKKANIYIYDEDYNLLYNDTLNTFSSINIADSQFIDTTKYSIASMSEFEYIPTDNDYSNNTYSWEYVGEVYKLPDTINNVSLKFVVFTKTKTTSKLLGSGGLLGASPLTWNSSSYREQDSSSGSNTSCFEQITFNNFLTLSNINVKMTQDDNKYYFNVSANSNIDVYGNGLNVSIDYWTGYRHTGFMLYKTSNFNNNVVLKDYIYNSTADDQMLVSFNGTNIINISDDDSYPDFANGKTYITPSLRSYITKSCYALYVRTRYITYLDFPHNNWQSLSMYSWRPTHISNNSSFGCSTYTYNGTEYIKNLNFNFNEKFSFNKSNIDDFRYLAFAANNVLCRYSSGTYFQAGQGYSLISNTIDLKDYTDCDHVWQPIKNYEINGKHIIKCTKCEWEKEADHDFIYEYDGYKNNLCICGKKSHIKMNYHFNTDLVSDYTLDTISTMSFIAPATPSKVGYNFKDFSSYIYDYNDALISTTSTPLFLTKTATYSNLPTIATSSMLFEANYYPIKYNIVFNEHNNIGLSISTPSQMICEYDTEYNLPNIDVLGWSLDGYSLASGSNVVDFNIDDTIKNLTITNGETFELYPVFSILKYKFKFNQENNLNIPITATISDLICEYGSSYTFPNNIDLVGCEFLGWSLATNSNVIDFDPNYIVYNYTARSETINVYPIYKILSYTLECQYISEVATKSIIMNVVCLTEQSLPKLYTLPLSAKVYGWYYENNKVNTTLDVDKFVSVDNDYIKIFYKVEDGAISYGEDDGITDISDFTFKINYIYRIRKHSNNSSFTTESYNLSNDNYLYSISYFTDSYDNYSGNKFWICNNNEVSKISDVGKYLKYNDEIIDIEFVYKSDSSNGGGNGNGQIISNSGKKIIDEKSNTDDDDIYDYVDPQYYPYLNKILKNNPEVEDEIKDTLITGFALTEADLKGYLSDSEIKEVDANLKNISYIVNFPISNLERFKFYLRYHKGIVIGFLVLALIIAIVIELWYYKRLDFARKNIKEDEKR